MSAKLENPFYLYIKKHKEIVNKNQTLAKCLKINILKKKREGFCFYIFVEAVDVQIFRKAKT